MKKLVILATILTLALALTACGKSADTAAETDATGTTATGVMINPDNFEITTSIKLINSDEDVYIEGMSEEQMSYMDEILRLYEQIGTDTIDPAGENGNLAWFYNPAAPQIVNWFDPSFNVIEACQAIPAEERSEAIATLLEQYETDPENSGIYFKKDEELSAWRMSSRYFILGLEYSDAKAQVDAYQEEVEAANAESTEEATDEGSDA